MTDKPVSLSIANPLFENTVDKNRRLSRWFVTNQKHGRWDEKALNALHIRTVLSLVAAYACHVVGSPFIQFVRDETALTIIHVIETLCTLISILCFVKMCCVNASWTATKLLFAKDSVETYIFLFWLLRCFVIEILKGQVIYSFVISFHSIMIFGTDTWYMCNRKVLIASIGLYLLMITYEFLVTISPVGPTKPSWTFMNVETTANSLSRSNYFNLFVIFFDALIIVIYDVNRSKYVMLVKERKRTVLEVSSSKERMLKRLWIAEALIVLAFVTCFLVDSSSGYLSSIYPGLGDIVVGIGGTCIVCCYSVIFYFSSSSESTKVFYNLIHERRVIFILLLLGILFYIDNIFLYWSASGLFFPIEILCYISFDMIVMYFPRRLALVTMILIVLVLLWNIFNHTFLISDCQQYKLRWGIFGEEISYCTIKRLIYQTILSLMVSAAFAIFAGRTDNLFFCSANIYRSTGTINRSIINEKYIESMKMEKKRGNNGTILSEKKKKSISKHATP
jgi:hypothetical protein